MDRLLNPDTGLIIWTITTFLTLVLLLKLFAWGPLLAAIEAREHRIKGDMEGAQKARNEAERIQKDLQDQMNSLQAKSREMLAQAQKEAEALRAQLKASAEADSAKIREKTMQELGEEKERLVRDLRKEVGNLSVIAAERLMRKSVDDNVQKTVLEGFYKDLESKKVGA